MPDRTTAPLTLAPVGDAPPRGTFRTEPLGGDPTAGVKLTGGGHGGGYAITAGATLLAAGLAATICWYEFNVPTVAAAIAGAGVLLAGGLAVFGLLLAAAVDAAQLAVAPWPLRPGGVVELRFAQRLKRGLTLNELLAEVNCVESARYTVGTDTRTDTRTRLNRHLEPVDLKPAADGFAPARDAVTAAWTLNLPPDLPPSLDTHHSDVTWSLKVTLVIDRHPDAVTTFPLEVR